MAFIEDFKEWTENNITDLKSSKITFLLKQGLIIEGHKKIISFLSDCIKIKFSDDVITITGSELNIRYIDNSQLFIKGKISAIYKGDIDIAPNNNNAKTENKTENKNK
jgi:sporulation protein YqfC